MQTRRAVIYIRVSTDEQAENGTSLETQELACLRKAAEMSAQVIAVHRDEGVSGARYQSRSGVQRALADIEAGKADALVVYSLSRLSRDVEHQQNIRKRLERAGAALVIYDMPIEDTEEGDLMFGVKGSFDQYERKLIRKRTMQGRRRNAEKGQMPYRAISPFGYKIVNKKDVLHGRYPLEQVGQYVVIEDEAAVVRQIFLRAAAGQALRSLGLWLDATGVPTRRGSPCWKPVVIRGILNNPTYKGVVLVGRHEYVFHEEGSPDGKPTYKTRWRDESECIRIAVPALVDEATWNACQERLATNKARLSGNPGRRHLLSGLLVCPACGKRMKGATSKGVLYYRCYEETICPYRKHTRGSVIDGMVVRAVRALAGRPEMLATALRAYSDRQMPRASAATQKAAETELAELQSKERATVQAQIAGIAAGADPAIYDGLFAEIAAQRQKVHARLDAVKAASFQETFDPDNTGQVLARACADVETALTDEALLPAERNRLLGTVVHAIFPPTEGDAYRMELAPLPGSGLTVSKVSTWRQVGAVVRTTVSPSTELNIELRFNQE